MDAELATKGQEARNQLQLRLLEIDEMDDALAGLQFVRTLPEVDRERVAVAGHSFGGALTLLVAERDRTLQAAVVFSAPGYSWERSPPLRERLLDVYATSRYQCSSFTPPMTTRSLLGRFWAPSWLGWASRTASRSILR
jgi:dienelactone hydrolase